MVEVARTYFVCAGCGDSGCPLDDRLGLERYVSPEALRLLCLAGASWSFDNARAHLREFAGIEASDELIRQTVLREGPKMAAFAQTSAEAVETFAATVGEAEFETDATKVNTTEGWRDAKIGIFAKRQRGPAAETAQWADRPLPKPSVRFAFADSADSATFAASWASTAQRLGIDPSSEQLSVLGDGAEWIWNRTAEQFPQAQQVLDVFHATEYVADAAKGFFGEGTSAVKAGRDRGIALLLSDGYAGVTAWVGELSQCPQGGDGAALGTMLNYLAGHQDRMPYALRLHRGQSIGSGLVEGAAKNLIGQRLKANNARWLAGNVQRMAPLCCALYSETWAAYWQSHG
ncbi:MAG: hypothetical protein ACRD13_15320 [Terriglobales bacterium]